MSDDLTLKDTIFREFLKDPSLGPSEMTDKLGANYNSVKAAFAKLADESFLERPSRGNYEPNIAFILLNLMERVTTLEESVSV
jgi:predicted transcriptional regulator